MHTMNLSNLIQVAARKLLTTGVERKSKKWQGIPLENRMFEAIKVYLGPAQMPDNIQELTKQTKPNLPWAEDHFKERVGGKPLNPGDQYKNWPFYGRDKEMRTEGEKFTHTYMERFWPKYAGETAGMPNKMLGIRYEYGDLQDVVMQLVNDPETRQAYLPIFFPEDTGAVHGGRVPCTLGYLFQYRDGYLHITYHIRSCDFIRHFQDDIYMAVRLVQYMCMQLRMLDPFFKDAKPGLYDMHIGSLHIFNHEQKRVAKEFNFENLLK